MNKTIALCMLLMIFFSCKKDVEIISEPVSMKDKAVDYLKNTLSETELQHLDMSNIQVMTNSRKEAIGIRVFEINNKRAFFLVTGTENGYRADKVNIDIDFNKHEKNGSISVNARNTNVERKVVFEGKRMLHYKNGILVPDIRAIHAPNRAVGDNVTLDEVVVTGYIKSKPVYLISYEWLTGGASQNAAEKKSFLIADEDPQSGGEFVELDEEDDSEIADLEKLLNCLMKLYAQNGASCKITLYVDVPINSYPEGLIDFDFSTGKPNPGHAFIGLSVINGSNTYTQYFGFYPESSLAAGTKLPVSSVIKNDKNHEYNASVTREITASQFSTIVMKAGEYSINDYDIDDNNCTDYALSLYNIGVSNPIVCEKVINPYPFNFGGLNPNMNTPQGLYKTLDNSKNNGNVMVQINNSGLKVGFGLGECNRN